MNYKDQLLIEQIPKYILLQSLYNRSKPLGMGFLQFVPGSLSDEEAKALTSNPNNLRFDYLRGRIIKTDLNNPSGGLYDRNLGEGEFELACIDAYLRWVGWPLRGCFDFQI